VVPSTSSERNKPVSVAPDAPSIAFILRIITEKQDVDSPVYTFLPQLQPPSPEGALRARDAGVAEDAGAVEFGFGGALRSSALTAPGPSTEKFSTLLELFREAFREATREDDFRLPRKYLESFARSCPMTRI
jgi:hypothetical protein